MDVLQFDAAQQPSTAHLQLEDMHALGRLILALACGSMAAVTRETLPQVRQTMAATRWAAATK